MFNTRNFKKIIGLLVWGMVVGCTPLSMVEPTPTPTPAPERVILKISGSGSVTSVLDAVAPAFEADNPGYYVEVLAGSGTGGGVKGIISGVLDAAAMARPPKPEETEQGIAYVEFGKSGVAIYAHPDVTVTNLSTDQLKAVFSGEITRWSEVGGADEPIIWYVRDEGDSSTQALRDVIMGDVPFPEAAQVLTSQGDMLIAVAGTPHSVGFGTWTTARAENARLKAIAIDGVGPDNPAYPMLATLGIGYLKNRQADVKPFFDWLLSDKGQQKLQEFEMIVQ
ncbi:MAG: substrate-binding domain-containing protein [Anaerolineae bacterium]|nr:substrate-binding domain-containing protein [Anaerolineae bacterium]